MTSRCSTWQTTQMEYLNISFRLLAISQTILFSMIIACSANPKRVKVIGVGLMLGCMAYLGMPLIEKYTPYYDQFKVLWIFSAVVPSLLLLFVYFIFEESCQIPKWMIALIVVSVGSSLWFQITNVGLPGSPQWLQVLKAFIALTAIVVVWKGRDYDLVEMRAKVRNVFIFVLAIETFIVISVEVATHFNPPIVLDTFIQFCILAFTLTVNYLFARLNPEGKLMRTSQVVPKQPEQVSDPIVVELLDRMKDERLYADHDLRVGSLAQALNIPEYKLRQKINQELGYRNFNQFVNHYRIEEAGEKLRQDNRTPVLTIALDVGFRSISSFNSAFQSHFGLSPTQYRSDTM